MIREQWLCTTLYSGIKAGSTGFRSGLRPDALVCDFRLFKDDIAGALLRVRRSVDRVLVVPLLVDDVGEARNDEAHGRPCVRKGWSYL